MRGTAILCSTVQWSDRMLSSRYKEVIKAERCSRDILVRNRHNANCHNVVLQWQTIATNCWTFFSHRWKLEAEENAAVSPLFSVINWSIFNLFFLQYWLFNSWWSVKCRVSTFPHCWPCDCVGQWAHLFSELSVVLIVQLLPWNTAVPKQKHFKCLSDFSNYTIFILHV